MKNILKKFKINIINWLKKIIIKLNFYLLENISFKIIDKKRFNELLNYESKLSEEDKLKILGIKDRNPDKDDY